MAFDSRKDANWGFNSRRVSPRTRRALRLDSDEIINSESSGINPGQNG